MKNQTPTERTPPGLIYAQNSIQSPIFTNFKV